MHFPKLISYPLNLSISLFILTLGLFLIFWSILHFIKVKGTPVPFNPPPKLVTTGPYAYVRNPMLSGVFILMFGFGILFNSISLVFLFTSLFILLNFLEIDSHAFIGVVLTSTDYYLSRFTGNLLSSPPLQVGISRYIKYFPLL